MVGRLGMGVWVRAGPQPLGSRPEALFPLCSAPYRPYRALRKHRHRHHFHQQGLW